MPTRKLGLSDAMISVAATALGLAPARFLFGGMDKVVGYTLERFWAMRLVICATPVLAGLTLAALAISLRPPRHRRLRLMPGFVGCVSAAACIAMVATVELGGVLLSGKRIDLGIARCTMTLHQWAAGAVAGSWIALWGRRRSDAVDRAGIAVGLGWFALAVVWWVQNWILANG